MINLNSLTTEMSSLQLGWIQDQIAGTQKYSSIRELFHKLELPFPFLSSQKKFRYIMPKIQLPNPGTLIPTGEGRKVPVEVGNAIEIELTAEEKTFWDKLPHSEKDKMWKESLKTNKDIRVLIDSWL